MIRAMLLLDDQQRDAELPVRLPEPLQQPLISVGLIPAVGSSRSNIFGWLISAMANSSSFLLSERQVASGQVPFGVPADEVEQVLRLALVHRRRAK